MGLFDLFKKKDKPEENNAANPASENNDNLLPTNNQSAPIEEMAEEKADAVQSTEMHEESAHAPTESASNAPDPAIVEKALEYTRQVGLLLQTEREKRDQAWAEKFFAAFPHAIFKSAPTQVVNGPDGFPYFQIFMPEEGEGFDAVNVNHLAHSFLGEHGIGLVLNPTDKGEVDWVFTHGDIVNYLVNGEFYNTKPTPFSKKKNDEQIQQNEEVMIGQPAEQILPTKLRKVLKNFTTQNGKNDVKVLMIMKKDQTQDLAFNLTPAQFESEDHFRGFMHALGWFLPRHYSYVGIDEKAFGPDAFKPL